MVKDSTPTEFDISTINIWSDGGARGNPGPAGIGFVIKDNIDKIILDHHEYIGKATNNIAEYKAVLSAVTSLNQFIHQKNLDTSHINIINIFLDSLLVVKQLSGEYKIKNPDLFALATQILNITHQNKLPIKYSHIPRHRNTQADALVNQALDSHLLL